MQSAPTYVQSFWRQQGFKITHRGALRWVVIHSMRAALARGLGASGFQKGLVERYKQRYFETSRKWRSYVDFRFLNPMITQGRMVSKEPFVTFFSEEYGGKVPTLAYLIRQVTEEIETLILYYTLKQTMIDGNSLAGDHSHKITKKIRVDGDRAYEAFYSLMNPHVQIVGFWFTNGTGLDEVEKHIERLMDRYTNRGFEGPLRIDTDRCCSERKFWKKNLRRREKETEKDRTGGTQESIVLPAQGGDGNISHQRVLTLPPGVDPIYTKSAVVIGTEVGNICEHLESVPRVERVVGCDCEWTIGSNKAETIQIGLLDGRTWVFQASGLSRIPLPLKSLLENKTVKKVGNRICSDVQKLRGWNVQLGPTVELGKLAKARCLSVTQAPPLDFLIRTLFKCELPKGPNTDRVSIWSPPGGLTKSQIEYAALDAYASIKAYEKLLTIMNPLRVSRIPNRNMKAGSKVSIFNEGWKSCAATGSLKDGLIVADADGVECMEVCISRADDDAVFTPDSRVRSYSVAADSESAQEQQKLGMVVLVSDSSTAIVLWPRSLIRAKNSLPSHTHTNTVNVATRLEAVEDDVIGFNNELTHNSTEALVENLRKEKVKNDILHIFLRFERVLSKEHGAFPLFMSALRDALYIVNKDDVMWVRECLRESGMAPEKIDKKLRTEFDWCLRRIRRHVPAPAELERRYCSVVSLYCDVKDGKTGKPFFDSRAEAVHKSTLGHIQKNCLSDVPGMSYYVQVGTDRLGIPLLKCSRGTSALEGFHQKLRQLIRGFCLSPRFARAIVYEFIYRWNMDLEVHARGLPKEYEYFYDGPAIENEILIMERWQEEFEVHPEWGRAFKCPSNEEQFGIPLPDAISKAGGKYTDYNIGSKEDIAMEMDARFAAEAYAEQEAGDQADIDVSRSVEESRTLNQQSRPESVAWLCTYSGREKPMQKIGNRDEWKYFEENYHKFQDRNVGSTADNYTFVNWSVFAEQWNQMVFRDEQQKKKATPFTYKNAAILKDAWKQFKRRRNTSTTMLGHIESAKQLRETLRKDNATAILCPPADSPKMVQIPNQSAANEELGEQYMNPLFAPQLQAQTTLLDGHASTERSPRTTQKRSKKKKRSCGANAETGHHCCRQCGNPYRVKPWIDLHNFPEAPTVDGEDAETKRKKNLMYANGLKPHHYCTVNPYDYAEKFPALEGTMPRVRKKRKAHR